MCSHIGVGRAIARITRVADPDPLTRSARRENGAPHRNTYL
ncbi:hypothetical protein AB0O65_04275 [Microbacterium sp. NPDC077391]|nr:MULTISPECIES: hypothetical protein [Microbacterium]